MRHMGAEGRCPMVTRVLSVDGGGMRGVYSAAYLQAMVEAATKRRNLPDNQRLDVGKAFDLVVGTSTGAIIGCGLAYGLDLAEIVQLYKQHGQKIFPQRLASNTAQALPQLVTRSGKLAEGEGALREALCAAFGETTILDIYRDRQIKLCVPTVNMANYQPWVFKTPHNSESNHRDDNVTLVDACLASSAAPLYRSLAAVNMGTGPATIFADGGLWANNPVLVALSEALDLAPASDEPIEIYCLGSCGKPEGEIIDSDDRHRGLGAWKFGGGAAVVSIAAQEFAFDYLARSLADHIPREIHIIRFPSVKIPSSLLDCLGLDETCEKCLDALIGHARTDADMTNTKENRKTSQGKAIRELFDDHVPTVSVRSTNDV